MKVHQKTNPDRTQNKKTMDFRKKYKTEKCRYLMEYGYCPFNNMCAFAHDETEIRQKATIHTRYKTKLCLNFTKSGFCKYGDRCLFLHEQPSNKSDDGERTRSNSPQSDAGEVSKNHLPKKHRTNLKILMEFGLDVFKAHMNRYNSKIVKESSFSEDFELPHQIKQDPFDEYSFYEKKSRMYSM